jgi:hypothetical protein
VLPGLEPEDLDDERVVPERHVAREGANRAARGTLDRGAERRLDRLLILAADVLDGVGVSVRDQNSSFGSSSSPSSGTTSVSSMRRLLALRAARWVFQWNFPARDSVESVRAEHEAS